MAAIMLVLAYIVAAWAWTRTAPCPSCGRNTPPVDPGDVRACIDSKCGRWLQGNKSEIWLATEDAVAEKPTIPIELPERFELPPLCCACGGAATRSIELEVREGATGTKLAVGALGLALGRIVIMTGGGTTYRISSPHCDAHDDGAVLEKPKLGKLTLKVRSLRFHHAFRERNGKTAA
jgi:hypothetical protein